MAKIAIIKTGGKQYVVKQGDALKVEKLKAEAGESVKFDTLMVADEEGNSLELGNPSLGEKITAKVIEHGKTRKVTGVKYKNKTRYKKTIGHRQDYTKVEIASI